MKSTFFTALLLSVTLTCFSQTPVIQGEIRNAATSELLPYVTIGISNKNAGTVSDKQGVFTLALPAGITQNDTLVFSCIGFETRQLRLSDLSKSNQVVLLQPKAVELNEVVVAPEKKKRKPRTIGRNDKGLGLMHYNFYTAYEKDVDDRLSKEVGVGLKIRSDCRIRNLNFHITQNEFRSVIFRVNMYKIENGVPTELLVTDNILFEIKDNYTGWFTVDLTPYDIYLNETHGDVAVTIQWLESKKTSEKSKYFAISAAQSVFHTTYVRNKAMDKWSSIGGNLSFYLNALCD